MKKIIYICLLFVTSIINGLNTQEDKSKLIIEVNDCYNIEYPYEIVENINGALKIGAIDSTKIKNIEIKKYYYENADVFFEIGGGCFTPYFEELSTKIENDTIKIYWNRESNEPCPEVGDAVPFCRKIKIIKTSDYSQKINSYFNKTLISKVGYTCMETAKPDPCAGNEIYASIEISKDYIHILEKTVSTCGKEEYYEIGRFKWKQLNNQIEIDYKLDKSNIYAKILFLELEKDKVIGKIKYRNGKIEDKIFTETKK